MSGRLALDLSCLEAHPETGVERYARRLAEHLPVVAPELDVTCFVRAGGPMPVVGGAAEVVSVSSRLPRPIWRETALPRELRRRNISLLHAPVAAIPVRTALDRIATIHDMPPPGDTGDGPLLSRNRLRAFHACYATRALVVPSAATAEAIKALDPGLQDKIHVIPHGVDADFTPHGLALERRRYGIPPRPYILWVGTIRPRKDPLVLVRAFAGLLAAGADLSLVMSGDLRMDPAELRAPLEGIGAADRLVLPGYVYRQDLPELYREAEVVVVPSRVEGFGLCALEAMASGRPLVISEDAALVELAEGAARTFTTGDAGDLQRTLQELLDAPAERRRLGAAGVERAAAYSWDASARAHADLYRGLLGPDGS